MLASAVLLNLSDNPDAQTIKRETKAQPTKAMLKVRRISLQIPLSLVAAKAD